MIYLEKFVEEIVGEKVREELSNLEKEIRLLNELISKLGTAFFYVEVYLPHSRTLESVAFGENPEDAVAEAEAKIKSKAAFFKWKLYILMPVTQEVIAYIGRIGTPGKALMSISGLTSKSLTDSYGFSSEDVEALESSIAFFVPEELWKKE